MGQGQPVLGRRGFQAAERTNGALAWALGGLDRFDQEMIQVGFAFIGPGCLADVHWPLHIAPKSHAVNKNLHKFSHYFENFRTVSSKQNTSAEIKVFFPKIAW